MTQHSIVGIVGIGRDAVGRGACGTRMPARATRTTARAAPLALGLAAALLLGACGGGQEARVALPDDLGEALRAQSAAYADRDLDALRRDGEALALGGALFGVYCAGCHGADGRGEKGVTDLTRGYFSYGTSADAIRTTIRDGRHSEMPSMGRDFGEVELGQLVAFVRSLSADETLSDYEERGRVFFAAACAACHGDDGRGRTEPGAPDLADDYWQHGDSMMNIRLVITRGAMSDCPPHGEVLSDAEVELLTAYLLQWIGS